MTALLPRSNPATESQGTSDSIARAVSFANEVPDALENAKKAEGFVKLTGLKVGGRTSVEACRCDVCRMILISYGEEAAKI